MPKVDKEFLKEMKVYKENQKTLRNLGQEISADMGRDILGNVQDSLPDKRKTAAQRFKERYGK